MSSEEEEEGQDFTEAKDEQYFTQEQQKYYERYLKKIKYNMKKSKLQEID